MLSDSSASQESGAADITVLVGPEGDFSIDEVRLALENGYESVSLGNQSPSYGNGGLGGCSHGAYGKKTI